MTIGNVLFCIGRSHNKGTSIKYAFFLFYFMEKKSWMTYRLYQLFGISDEEKAEERAVLVLLKILQYAVYFFC